MPLALLVLGCAAVCPEKQPLLGLDGGPQVCTRNTDCPRPSNILVCSSTDDQQRDCVACIDTQCVRWVPKECR